MIQKGDGQRGSPQKAPPGKGGGLDAQRDAKFPGWKDKQSDRKVAGAAKNQRRKGVTVGQLAKAGVVVGYGISGSWNKSKNLDRFARNIARKGGRAQQQALARAAKRKEVKGLKASEKNKVMRDFIRGQYGKKPWDEAKRPAKKSVVIGVGRGQTLKNYNPFDKRS